MKVRALLMIIAAAVLFTGCAKKNRHLIMMLLKTAIRKSWKSIRNNLPQESLHRHYGWQQGGLKGVCFSIIKVVMWAIS